MDLCKNAIMEKIIRVSIAIFRNMIEKARSTNVTIMIGAKLLELMITFSGRKFSDEEIMIDILYIKKELTDVYQTLRYGTFDMCCFLLSLICFVVIFLFNTLFSTHLLSTIL